MPLEHLDFDALVQRSLTDPGAEAEVQRRFGTTAAILVVDFSGMVTRTDARGVLYALARARQAEAALALTGTRVKRMADTVFALYTSAREALFDAFDAQRRLHAAMHGSDDPVMASFGLGHGPMFLVPSVDVYGSEVSRAFVLGEDVAGHNEVLCTPEFLAALGGAPPPGIGSFRAPEEREADAGFPFHVLGDYRG